MRRASLGTAREAPAADRAQRPGRARLRHLDADRPLQQAGVITTHALLYFAPGASVAAGGAVLLTHVTREAFLFLSAAVAAYAYPKLTPSGSVGFWRRRLVSIGVPYLVWTLVYFAFTLALAPRGLAPALSYLRLLALSGYYQLYFLVVLAQFYLLLPVLLLVVAATRHHHGWLLAGSGLWQLVFTGFVHWHVLGFGWFSSYWGMRVLVDYQLYVLAGLLFGTHYQAVGSWLQAHRRPVVAGLVAATALAETWYVLAVHHVLSPGESASDAYQPAVVPFFVAAIAGIYLAGGFLVDQRRPAWLRRLVRRGVDTAYGVYLAQMLFILGLARLGWGGLRPAVPWPVLVAVAVAVTYLGGAVLASLLARTPLALAVTGQRRARPGSSPRRVTSAVEEA